MKNILTGLLSTAYKIDNGKIAELLDGENVNESEVLAEILKLDKSRVDEIKQSVETAGKFQEGYAKAKKEERSKYEEEIKAKFDLESEKTGTDLIEDLIVLKSENAKPAELTEQDIKKSSVYRNMESAYKKQLTEKETDYNSKLSELEKNHNKDKTFISIKDRATNFLETLKPVFSKNPKVAQTIKSNFLNELNAFDYEISEDGSVIVSKNGAVIEDGHGHSRSFDEIVKEVAGNYYDFEANNGGQNAGNQNSGNGGGSGHVQTFKTEQELFEYSNNPEIPLEDRLKAVEKFNEANN